jgi:hypothetical protein
MEEVAEERPFEGRPTVFVSIMDNGDVKVGAANQDLSFESALAALELAKQKVIAGHMRAVIEAQQKAQAATSLYMPNKKIVRP